MDSVVEVNTVEVNGRPANLSIRKTPLLSPRESSFESMTCMGLHNLKLPKKVNGHLDTPSIASSTHPALGPSTVADTSCESNDTTCHEFSDPNDVHTEKGRSKQLADSTSVETGRALSHDQLPERLHDRIASFKSLQVFVRSKRAPNNEQDATESPNAKGARNASSSQKHNDYTSANRSATPFRSPFRRMIMKMIRKLSPKRC